MEFTGSQTIAASREQVWQGLNDATVLQECIPGCEAFTAENEDEYKAVVVASVFGRLSIGLGLAAGLVLGSVNGYLIAGFLARRAPFVAASLLRIVLFSLIVVIAALAVRGDAWTLALGIGVAQLVMVAASVRAGLRS